jgi:GNAT superfamily N-acetyltransferase
VDEVEIVRIGPDEWREFREVRLASLRDAPGAFGASHADWVEAEEEQWRQRLSDVPFTLVARSAGAWAGVVSGVESGDAVELISMWVAPAHRGTGLAGRLIEQVVAWATGNEAAIRSYARAGFVDLGIPDGWPADALPERRMRHSAS